MINSENNVATVEIGPLKISFPMDIQIPPDSISSVSMGSLRPVLSKGELYAGIILGKNGQCDYHLILLPGEVEKVNHSDARGYASKKGGSLPTKREANLLRANLHEAFKNEAYWLDEEYEGDSSYAWYQYFYYGCQYYFRKSAALRAVAVRRFSL